MPEKISEFFGGILDLALGVLTGFEWLIVVLLIIVFFALLSDRRTWSIWDRRVQKWYESTIGKVEAAIEKAYAIQKMDERGLERAISEHEIDLVDFQDVRDEAERALADLKPQLDELEELNSPSRRVVGMVKRAVAKYEEQLATSSKAIAALEDALDEMDAEQKVQAIERADLGRETRRACRQDRRARRRSKECYPEGPREDPVRLVESAGRQVQATTVRRPRSGDLSATVGEYIEHQREKEAEAE